METYSDDSSSDDYEDFNDYFLLMEKQNNENSLYTVKKDGEALKYIKNQTLEICIAAIIQNRNAIKYVKKEFYEMIRASLILIIMKKR